MGKKRKNHKPIGYALHNGVYKAFYDDDDDEVGVIVSSHGTSKTPKTSPPVGAWHVALPATLWAEIMHYTKKASPKEVGGVLLFEPPARNGGDVILTAKQQVLVPQEVSYGAIDFDDRTIERVLEEHGVLDGTPLPYACFGTWHSHGTGGTFFSSRDETMLIEPLLCRGPLVTLVVNTKGERSARVDYFACGDSPETAVQVRHDATIEVVHVLDEAVLAALDENYTKTVREKTYTTKSVALTPSAVFGKPGSDAPRDAVGAMTRTECTFCGGKFSPIELKSPGRVLCEACREIMSFSTDNPASEFSATIDALPPGVSLSFEGNDVWLIGTEGRRARLVGRGDKFEYVTVAGDKRVLSVTTSVLREVLTPPSNKKGGVS